MLKHVCFSADGRASRAAAAAAAAIIWKMRLNDSLAALFLHFFGHVVIGGRGARRRGWCR